MRYLKITSADNPNTDYIELNDFNGYLCTSFTTLGISRKYETFTVGNRQFSVDNKPKFKDYSLTVHILTKYSLWEQYYRELINFFDRNKTGGFRLYYRPYDEQVMRYILCDIKTTTKTEKMQPITLTVSQNSLWFGEDKKVNLQSIIDTTSNIFEFKLSDINDYYCASFSSDNDYYCISFYNGIENRVYLTNNCYNKIPLVIRIYGECINPVISLFRKNKTEAIHIIQIFKEVNNKHYIEINSNINENGVWLINKNTGEKQDYSEFVDNSLGSPYIYLDNGEYEIKITDGINSISGVILYNEEYSE